MMRRTKILAILMLLALVAGLGARLAARAARTP